MIFVLPTCHTCGHSLIAHGSTERKPDDPYFRPCWQCKQYDGPCKPAV